MQKSFMDTWRQIQSAYNAAYVLKLVMEDCSIFYF